MFRNLKNALKYRETKVDFLKYNPHIGNDGVSQNGLIIKNKFRDNLIKTKRVVSK